MKKKNTWRYHHSTHLHHKWILLDVWFLRYGAQLTELFLILGHFLPFYPTNNQKNQNFEKNKKKAWRYIILHKCNKNHDHMLYCSWDMALDGCNCYFSYWAIFCHFTSLTSPKNQNIKKMKKTSRDIIILHKCSKSRDHMLYCSMLCNTDIWCMTGVIVIFHFGIFLPFYSLTVQNIKILKK